MEGGREPENRSSQEGEREPESWSGQEGMCDRESRNGQEGERDPGTTYRAWSVGELADELAKDRIFYDESGGGATLSGGEPLSCNMAYISALMEELGRRGVSVAIDTCGDVPYAAFAGVLHLTDLFLYDIKMLDDSKHIFYTGVSNKRILENLSQLSRDGAAICLRLPLLAGVNDSLDDMERIARWLEAKQVKPKFISLLPYHAYARGKYTRLGLAPPAFDAPHAERLDELRHFWFASGYKVGFGGGGVPDII